MVISRLSDAAVRELGSTLAISSTIILVKELVENAIDAGATFVDIIVSSNTLDKIEVRDNGHGIPLDDLDSLGRSGYTSKIRSFDEVVALGARSFGFRGVALASINTVAETTLTTRTAADPVATTFKLSSTGGVSNRVHSPAPVGTTVCATKLFSRTPVREKLALKEATGNLIKIKELLQSYALARPHIKLHLRVLRGQTITWRYSPKPEASVRDAAVQLFGTELASNCILQNFHGKCLRGQLDSEASSQASSRRDGEDSDLVFEAYLPSTSAEVGKVARRAFFSVDSRPVSTKGTFKKLYTLFKTYLFRSISPVGSNDAPKVLFIRLNIRCPPGSYDPNIEPSKDDVLFHDENHVIDQFKKFLSMIYPGPLGGSENMPGPIALAPPDPKVPRNNTCTSPEPSLDNQDPGHTSQQGDLVIGSESACSRPTVKESPKGHNLTEHPSYHIELHYTPTTNHTLPTSINETRDARNGTGLVIYPTPPDLRSPIADTRKAHKELSEIIKTTTRPTYSTNLEPKSGAIQHPSTNSEMTDATTNRDYRESHTMTVPVEGTTGGGGDLGYIDHSPGLHLRPPASSLVPADNHTTASHNKDISRNRSSVVDTSTGLNGLSDNLDTMPNRTAPPGNILLTGRGGSDVLDEEDENPLEGLNIWSIAKLAAPPRHTRHPRTRTPDPEPDTRDIPMGFRRHGPSAQTSFQSKRGPGIMDASRASGASRSKVPGGLYKKPTVTRPGIDRPRRPTTQTTLCLSRDVDQAVLGLRMRDEGIRKPMAQATISETTAPPVRLSTEDPRGYLLRGQQSIANNAQNKLRRLRTELLPLEVIPLDSEMHSLALTVNVSLANIVEMFAKVSRVDPYMRDGGVECGLHDNITREDIGKLFTRAEAISQGVGRSLH